MANYQQLVISGDSWVRSNRIVIENPLNGTPNISFAEEKVVVLGDDILHSQFGLVMENMTDPASSFPVINPMTGESTGTTATHGDIYALLHSLYLDLAGKRDAYSNSI